MLCCPCCFLSALIFGFLDGRGGRYGEVWVMEGETRQGVDEKGDEVRCGRKGILARC